MGLDDWHIEDYEPDVQEYIKTEQAAADRLMTKDEIYINSKGIHFLVLKDAPIGDPYVKVKCIDNLGVYRGYRPKIVLIS